MKRILAILLVTGTATLAAAHDTGQQKHAAEPATHRPSSAEMTAYAALLGQPPVLIVDLGEQQEVAVLATPSGRHQMAFVDWYLKEGVRMPLLLEADVGISHIHMLGDLVSFRAQESDATLDYLWEFESSGPPYWKRVRKGTGQTAYSPNLGEHRVAEFYLRDPQAPDKLAAARKLAPGRSEPVYIDSTVLILPTPSGGGNPVLRWAGQRWLAAGEIPGVLNHHAIADLTGDGMVEVLAGDTTVRDRCMQSWSALFTWSADKTRVVEAPIRATSNTNLAGGCDQRPPTCFQEESLTWDASAQPAPVVELKGTQDTTGPGCAPQGQTGSRKTYLRRYRWDAAQGAFTLVMP